MLFDITGDVIGTLSLLFESEELLEYNELAESLDPSDGNLVATVPIFSTIIGALLLRSEMANLSEVKIMLRKTSSSSIYSGSKVTFTAEAGRKYLVRLMALGDGSSTGWSLGSISFSCINGNSNCCSPNWGQTCCSNSSCCASVCEVDPFCCTTEWDQACANRALGNCPSCGGTTQFSGDINNDGLVNGLDLSILLGQWGTSGF